MFKLSRTPRFLLSGVTALTVALTTTLALAQMDDTIIVDPQQKSLAEKANVQLNRNLERIYLAADDYSVGTAGFTATVDGSGTVTNITKIHSSRNRAQDKAAELAISRLSGLPVTEQMVNRPLIVVVHFDTDPSQTRPSSAKFEEIIAAARQHLVATNQLAAKPILLGAGSR
jgi:hypothetical protein